jgi:hypothetical protein
MLGVIKSLFSIVFILVCLWAEAQSYSQLDATCIDIDGKELLNPFVGGLSYG